MARLGGKIPLATAHHIKGLLRQNRTKVAIARECRVGRDTVYRILWGRHWSCRPDAPRIARCGRCRAKAELPPKGQGDLCRGCLLKTDH